jgi:hypothetical protein
MRHETIHLPEVRTTCDHGVKDYMPCIDCRQYAAVDALLTACKQLISNGHRWPCGYDLVEDPQCQCGVWQAEQAITYATSPLNLHRE